MTTSTTLVLVLQLSSAHTQRLLQSRLGARMTPVTSSCSTNRSNQAQLSHEDQTEVPASLSPHCLWLPGWGAEVTPFSCGLLLDVPCPLARGKCRSRGGQTCPSQPSLCAFYVYLALRVQSRANRMGEAEASMMFPTQRLLQPSCASNRRRRSCTQSSHEDRAWSQARAHAHDGALPVLRLFLNAHSFAQSRPGRQPLMHHRSCSHVDPHSSRCSSRTRFNREEP